MFDLIFKSNVVSIQFRFEITLNCSVRVWLDPRLKISVQYKIVEFRPFLKSNINITLATVAIIIHLLQLL